MDYIILLLVLQAENPDINNENKKQRAIENKQYQKGWILYSKYSLQFRSEIIATLSINLVAQQISVRSIKTVSVSPHKFESVTRQLSVVRKIRRTKRHPVMNMVKQ